MPSKKDHNAASLSNAPSSSPSPAPRLERTLDELIEALLDSRLVTALSNALGPKIDEVLQRHLAPIQTAVRELREETTRLERDRAALTASVTEVMTENRTLISRLEEIERYTRRDNIIISGLPEGSYSEAGSQAAGSSTDDQPIESSAITEKTVLKLFNESMGLNLTATDIAIAHRLKKSSREQFRPIIVRLANKRIRDAILRAKKSLRNDTHNQNIYISEHITQAASKLLFEARQLVKSKRIASAWTMNGRVLIKIKVTDTKGVLIKTSDDLPK